MKTIIINKSDIDNSRLEDKVAEILNRENSLSDFQVCEDENLVADYRDIIEYDLFEPTKEMEENEKIEYNDPIYWHIVNTNYNEDGTIHSVDLDC